MCRLRCCHCLSHQVMSSGRWAVCALALVYAERLRRDLHKIKAGHKLQKIDLNPPDISAWRRVREGGNNRGYIIYTTFTKDAFDRLYELAYPPVPESDIVNRGGRPTLLSKYDYLAMTLYWLHSANDLNTVASLFCCPPSTCSRWIRNTLMLLARKLPHAEESKIAWPSEEQCREYAVKVLDYMKRKRNTGQYVAGLPIGFMDGCNLPVGRHGTLVVADKFYARWKARDTVSNLFVWGPDGTILHAHYNAPGAVHDSSIATNAYRLLKTLPRPYIILADCAFARTEGRVVTTQAMELVSRSRRRRERNKQIASLRVAAEWGNAQLQGAWARLTQPLPTKEQHRKRIIGVCLHLNNYRARVDNISQIRTVYDPDWVGNWRRGQHVASNMEQYIEAMRLRAGRQQVEARAQVVSAARAASQQRSSSSSPVASQSA